MNARRHLRPADSLSPRSAQRFFSATHRGRQIDLLSLFCAVFWSSACIETKSEDVYAAPNLETKNSVSSANNPATVPTTDAATPSASFDHASYVLDGDEVPQRVAARRIFLRRSRVNSVRDPFMVDNESVYFVAKVAGVQGLWKLELSGNFPAELVIMRPQLEPAAPIGRRNRNNWFIGTPRPFPDGQHAIFGGTSLNPHQKYTNVLGIVSLAGGAIEPVEIMDVKIARTPDVHPDGKTIVFSSCDGLRLATLDHHREHSVLSRPLLELPRREGVPEVTCTAFRPRFSPDGTHVVFELIGKFTSEAFQQEHELPTPQNPGDFVLMPWRIRTDGTGLAPLIDAAVFATLGGRVQTGGTQDPTYAPDGQSVAINHGHRIALVQTDGSHGQILLGTTGLAEAHPTQVHSGNIRFQESDPIFSPDGNKIVSASRLFGAAIDAPPGFTVLNVKEAQRGQGTAPRPTKPMNSLGPGDLQ